MPTSAVPIADANTNSPSDENADLRHKLTSDERQRGARAGGKARAEKLAAERAELAELRRDRLDAAVRRLAEAAERAAAVVEELIDARDEAVKLRAALGLLKVLDLAERAELAARLERLEASLNGGRR